MEAQQPQEAPGIPGAGLSLEMNEEQGALLASCIPTANAAPIDEAWLRARIAELGYAHLRYIPTAATMLLGQYNAGKPVAGLRLAECVDATLTLHVRPDAMEASLDLTPPQGGKPMTLEKVLAALAEKGIKAGIMPEAIDAALLAGTAVAHTIARGKPPEAGKDGFLESLVPEVRERIPHQKPSGQIDYRDLGDIFVVHPGDALMLRHHATEGVPGYTVMGAPIATKPGKEVAYGAKLPGTEINPENPDQLRSTLTGQPVVVKDGITVEPIFTLPQVDLSTGNINFDGNVVIKGDVTAGMSVKATGDIEITGVVEAASLEAGGNIVVKGGVMGSIDQKGESDYCVRCGHDFHAAYAQKARIEAGDSIFIDDMAMQCELTATNHIKVGKSKRGHIIGGRAQAMLSITAKVLGAPNRINTVCCIGVNPALQKRIRELQSLREHEEHQLGELAKLLEFAKTHPGRLPAETLEKARHTATAHNAEIQRLREEETQLTEELALAQEARVVAEQAMHEGVEVIFGPQHYQVVNEHSAGQVRMGENGLEYAHLD